LMWHFIDESWHSAALVLTTSSTITKKLNPKVDTLALIFYTCTSSKMHTET